MIYNENQLIELLDDEIKETEKEYDEYLLVGTTNRKIAMLKEIKNLVIAWFHSG